MATSQISTAIQAFRPDVYNQLIVLENYCYNNCPDPVSGATVTDYQTRFKSLSDAIVGWMQSSWSSGLGDFIMQLYSYKLMVDLYGADSSQLANSDANSIFSCNGLFPAILGYAQNYYFDATKTTTTDQTTGVTTTTLVFTHLPADTNTAQNAFTPDSNKFSSIGASMKSIIVPIMQKLLFQDLAQGKGLDKAGMATYVFDTLHYKPVYQNLNVGNLTLPPNV